MADGLNIFVSGRTGTGKSFLTLQAIGASPRLLVYQPKADDRSYPGIYFDARQGEMERRRMLEWWRYCVQHGRRFRIVYRPQNPFSLEEFNAIGDLAYQCGDMTLVCEEIMHYLATYDPRKPGTEGVTRLLTAGRTRGMTTWLLTQRPVQIPHVITSQARRAYLFATHEPAEVIYIRQAFGQAAAETLEQLKEHEHVLWRDTGEVEVGKA